MRVCWAVLACLNVSEWSGIPSQKRSQGSSYQAEPSNLFSVRNFIGGVLDKLSDCLRFTGETLRATNANAESPSGKAADC